MMVADGSFKVLKILSDAASIIAKGEVMQMMTEGKPETSIENYLQIISSKTAVLFSAACEVGAVITGHDPWQDPLREFGIYLGLAFQLIDDALDYAADQQRLGKTVGDDFREGKITLPVILAYSASSQEEKVFWIRTLAERQQHPDDLDVARTLMRKYNALSQTVHMAQRYCQKARHSLAGFRDSPAKTAMLELVDFCAARAY
jgi:octaprenyl-diphosphate synthase